MGQKVVYIYTKAKCPESQALKRYLSKEKVPYSEVDIGLADRNEAMFANSKHLILPGIIIEEKRFLRKSKRHVFMGWSCNRSTIEHLLHY